MQTSQPALVDVGTQIKETKMICVLIHTSTQTDDTLTENISIPPPLPPPPTLNRESRPETKNKKSLRIQSIDAKQGKNQDRMIEELRDRLKRSNS
jgi:hypothetical protein